MGVVNVTPDSFSDGGRFLDAGRAIEHGLKLLEEGADLLDLGAESTRPGSGAGPSRPGQREPLSAQEEHDRLIPILEGIAKERPDAILSVDTYKAATARAALAAGAEIINDVSGFTWDAEMASVCAQLPCGVVLMHTRGTPDEWRDLPPLGRDAVLPVVRDGLQEGLKIARAAGIPEERIVLDPGYGFGKRFDDNYYLLARQAELLTLGRPLLTGLSRKSFLTRGFSGIPKGRESSDPGVQWEARETASVAALVTAILRGASIMRVHEVRAAVEAAAIADAVLAAER
jgi:dihydropteroate synthase